jgi:hypothetical protein
VTQLVKNKPLWNSEGYYYEEFIFWDTVVYSVEVTSNARVEE